MTKLKKIEDQGMKKSRKAIMESLASVRNPDERKLEVFSEVFSEQFKALEKSPRARILGGIDDNAKLTLGECLTNYMLESNNQSNLGLNPLLAINVITSVFGNSVMPIFTSEQAITDKQGVIYFEDIVAKSTRGNVSEGDVLARGAGAKDVYPIGYAGEVTYGKELGTTEDSQTDYSLTLAEKIRPGYVNIQVGDVVITDDSKGVVFGAGVVGTVNYKTGAVTLKFSEAPEADLKFIGNYATDFEQGGVPVINAEFQSKVVKVGTFALQADTSILASYITKQRLGIDANKRIVDVLQQQILREITNDAVNKIVQATNADPLKNTQFNLTPPQAISVQAHYNSSNLEFAKMQNKMAKASGKGDIVALLAGTEYCEFLTGLNEFKQVGTITDDPTLFGTLGGRYGNIQVIRCPQLANDDAKCAFGVYKGKEKTDAAAVFVPFMPVVVTNDVPVADNLLQRRSMIASMSTTEVVVDRYLQKMTLTGAPRA